MQRIGAFIPAKAVRAGSFGLADQTIVSGVNFLVMIVGARALGPDAFGLFAVLHMVLVFMLLSQDCLIIAPFNVLRVGRDDTEYRAYVTSVASLQGAYALVLALGIVIAGIIAWQVYPGVASMLFVLPVAAIGWQLHEFVRRVLYAEARYASVLINDAAINILRALALGVLFYASALSAERIFLIMGVTWLLGALIGRMQISNSLAWPVSWNTLPDVAKQHWEFGRWLLATNAVSQLPRYLTAAIMPSILSVGAYGAYRAFAQITYGLNLPIQSLNSILRPKLANDAQAGPAKVWETMRPLVILGGIAFAAFALVLIVIREPLIRLVLGAEYAPFSAAILLLAFAPFFYLQNAILTSALVARARTRPIFVASTVSSVTGLGLGTAALAIFGLPAAGAIALASSMIAVVWLAWCWKRELDTERSGNAERAAIAKANTMS